MTAIKPEQLRKIYAIANALGMTSKGAAQDELHMLVDSVTGKESIKALTYKEADEVIVELMVRIIGQGAKPYKSSKSKKEHKAVPGGISADQQKKVWYLMYELQKFDRSPTTATLGERLCGIIKRELKIDARAENPFIWIDFSKGNKLIERLKQYVASAERKCKHG